MSRRTFAQEVVAALTHNEWRTMAYLPFGGPIGPEMRKLVARGIIESTTTPGGRTAWRLPGECPTEDQATGECRCNPSEEE